MSFPTAITFHGIDDTSALRAQVLEHVEYLELLLGDILACRVSVDAVSHHRSNPRYSARIRVTLPCFEIEAGGDSISEAHSEDPYLTVEDTFAVLQARIENFVRERCNSCAVHNPKRATKN